MRVPQLEDAVRKEQGLVQTHRNKNQEFIETMRSQREALIEKDEQIADLKEAHLKRDIEMGTANAQLKQQVDGLMRQVRQQEAKMREAEKQASHKDLDARTAKIEREQLAEYAGDIAKYAVQFHDYATRTAHSTSDSTQDLMGAYTKWRKAGFSSSYLRVQELTRSFQRMAVQRHQLYQDAMAADIQETSSDGGTSTSSEGHRARIDEAMQNSLRLRMQAMAPKR